MTRRAALCCLATAAPAWALGRRPLRGTLTMPMLWQTTRLDPHDAHDVATALLGSALFDPLFALGDRQTPYPTLATELPREQDGKVIVTLRAGLRSARGRTLDARDVVFSLQRAQRGGARTLLDGWRIRPRRGDGAAVEIAGARASDVARALTSPVTALVPRSFGSERPDGTGAFLATVARGVLVLQRNAHAARGGAYLDTIRLEVTPSLDEQLRAFEAREADVAWLGAGLHGKRKDAHPFARAPAGRLVLHGGERLERWGAPGVVQGLLDGMITEPLGALGVAAPAGRSASAWRGPKTELWVQAEQPHLRAVADALCAALSTPGHEITPQVVSVAALERGIRSRDCPLVLQFVRHVASDAEADLAAFLTATDPRLVLHRGRLRHTTAREACRNLPLGVVGELELRGFVADRFAEAQSLALADMWLRPTAP